MLLFTIFRQFSSSQHQSVLSGSPCCTTIDLELRIEKKQVLVAVGKITCVQTLGVLSTVGTPPPLLLRTARA